MTTLPPTVSITYLIDKIEHSGQILGFPPMPAGYGDIDKSVMVLKVVYECLQRASRESWEYLCLRIEREGLGVLKKILDGAPVLDYLRTNEDLAVPPHQPPTNLSPGQGGG